jgi:hypothetical protein
MARLVPRAASTAAEDFEPPQIRPVRAFAAVQRLAMHGSEGDLTVDARGFLEGPIAFERGAKAPVPGNAAAPLSKPFVRTIPPSATTPPSLQLARAPIASRGYAAEPVETSIAPLAAEPEAVSFEPAEPNRETAATAAQVVQPVEREATSETAPPAAPTGAQSPASLDELAGRLYDRIRARIRDELLIDRERAGLLTDVR